VSWKVYCDVDPKFFKPIHEFAEPYVDDIAVHSDDWQMHLKHLETFLMQMRKHNLTLNLKKCIFAKPKIKFIDIS